MLFQNSTINSTIASLALLVYIFENQKIKRRILPFLLLAPFLKII